MRKGWTNSYWKRQVLMFYPVGKKSKKPRGVASTPPLLVRPKIKTKDDCSSPPGYNTTRDSFPFRLVSIFINRKYVSFLYIKRNHMLNLLSCLNFVFEFLFVSEPPHAAETFSCCVKKLLLFLLSGTHQHWQLWCYNLLQSRYRQQDAAKTIFSLFSRNENLAKLHESPF